MLWHIKNLTLICAITKLMAVSQQTCYLLTSVVLNSTSVHIAYTFHTSHILQHTIHQARSMEMVIRKHVGGGKTDTVRYYWMILINLRRRTTSRRQTDNPKDSMDTVQDIWTGHEEVAILSLEIRDHYPHTGPSWSQESEKILSVHHSFWHLFSIQILASCMSLVNLTSIRYTQLWRTCISSKLRQLMIILLSGLTVYF